MIARLIDGSVRNALLIVLTTVFVVGAGIWALLHTPLDAIPDLSDTQVIVYTEFPGQAPQVVEDQVTYPLTTALLAVPRAKVVRGFSNFGVSFVYIVFEDGTDLYWARSRVLEYLNFASKRLPAGVAPSLGPDASGVGWVYQYVIEGAGRTLAELRSLQDWLVRFRLTAAEGVSEVAAIGGFERQYQIIVDPWKLQAYGIPLSRVSEAVRASSRDVGGRSIEMSETEYMVRGRGYLRGADDLARVVLKAEPGKGTPVLVRDVARVELGPDERRGIGELDGTGEAVGGIVVKRDGADALSTIRNVKAHIAELLPSLPEGVSIRPVYDRSELILRAIANLRQTLIEESVIVALVCAVFLLHVRSALVAVLTLPIGILIAFALMRALGIGSNIMSLGGIAIALGAMVDAAIVMVENAHKHIERLPGGEPRGPAIIAAAKEVGPSLFFSLLVITVSFLPVFALEDQEGRLFKPLAFTKTFAMAAGAMLSVTLVPVLMLAFVRGRILPEAKNPLNRLLIWLYRPVIRGVLRAPLLTVLVAVLVLAATVWPVSRLGSEFMPDLNEGTLLYMPVTNPGLSITKVGELLQAEDRVIKSFPEVASVFGKEVEAVIRTIPGATSAYSERIGGGHYLEIEPDRNAIARYGLSVANIQEAIATALGGEVVTTTVEGRERYGVVVRYPRSLRDNPQAIASDVLVSAGGAMVPLGQLAAIRITLGPPSIRTENAELVNYLYVDMRGRDLGGFVAEASRAVREQVKLPPGYRVQWSGQYEYLERAAARLRVVVPATLLVIVVLLYINFGRIAETLIVMLSVPFALVGGAWLMWWLGYNMSVAVVVGFIALAGVAAVSVVVMLIYLDQALRVLQARREREEQAVTRADLDRAIMAGAA